MKPNALQKEFATRAQEKGYIPPGERNPSTTSSSPDPLKPLDPIYEELGHPNLDYKKIGDLINKLSRHHRASFLMYRPTVLWLMREVLRGDYMQNGNSCGAWSLTHWLMREAEDYYGATDFRARALAKYQVVKFDIGDAGVGLHRLFYSFG